MPLTTCLLTVKARAISDRTFEEGAQLEENLFNNQGLLIISSKFTYSKKGELAVDIGQGSNKIFNVSLGRYTADVMLDQDKTKNRGWNMSLNHLQPPGKYVFTTTSNDPKPLVPDSVTFSTN